MNLIKGFRFPQERPQTCRPVTLRLKAHISQGQTPHFLRGPNRNVELTSGALLRATPPPAPHPPPRSLPVEVLELQRLLHSCLLCPLPAKSGAHTTHGAVGFRPEAPVGETHPQWGVCSDAPQPLRGPPVGLRGLPEQAPPAARRGSATTWPRWIAPSPLPSLHPPPPPPPLHAPAAFRPWAWGLPLSWGSSHCCPCWNAPPPAHPAPLICMTPFPDAPGEHTLDLSAAGCSAPLGTLATLPAMSGS